MYLNLCSPNISHASEHIKCISTCVEQTDSILERKIYISTCVEQTYPMGGRTRYISQLVLTNISHSSDDKKCISACQQGKVMHLKVCSPKPLLCQHEHKFYLNMCSPNNSNANEDSTCISTYLDQTQTMPVRTQNISQHVLTKSSHASQDKKCISKVC